MLGREWSCVRLRGSTARYLWLLVYVPIQGPIARRRAGHLVELSDNMKPRRRVPTGTGPTPWGKIYEKGKYTGKEGKTCVVTNITSRGMSLLFTGEGA